MAQAETYQGDTSEADNPPAYQGDTSEASGAPSPVSRPTATQPRFVIPPTGQKENQRKLPPLDLGLAYKTIEFYQVHPEFLANPLTTHAANAHLSQASKIIGMNMQLERVAIMGETSKAKNMMGKHVGTSLLKLAESGPEGAKVASKWYAVDEDGKPLYENPANWSGILDDYKDHTKATTTPATITLDDGTVVQGWTDPKTGRFTQFIDKVAQGKELIGARTEASKELIGARAEFAKEHIAQRLEGAKELLGLRGEATKDQIEQRFQNQLRMIDPKNEAAKELLQAKHDLALEYYDYKVANPNWSPGALEKDAEYLRSLKESKADPALIRLVEKRVEFGKLRDTEPKDVTVATEGDEGKVSERMTVAKHEAMKENTPDAETAKELKAYADHKVELATGDTRTAFGRSRTNLMNELKIRLESKGWNPETGKRLTNSAAPSVSPQQPPATTSGKRFKWTPEGLVPQ